MRKAYHRVKKYKINEVLPFVMTASQMRHLKYKKGWKRNPKIRKLCWHKFGKHEIRMFNQRYDLFVEKGTDCVVCGLEGKFFALERPVNHESKRYHFNLYGIDKGLEIMITKDHIIPRSKGGWNHLKNYQPMCQICNENKGDSLSLKLIPLLIYMKIINLYYTIKRKF